ncbi:metallophosphoesterase [Christensenellaceae bacterium OttesenSCG-928-K19]|nr:metallophosphoesterase [Christensenellaceae bacterium OttesenSCG-928-K19]
MRKQKPVLRVRAYILAAIGIILLIHIVSMLTLDRSIQYTETELVSERLSPSLDGYVIAFITDTHTFPEEEACSVVRHINERGADLLLLGGDHAQDGTVGDLMAILAEAEVTDGIYGVEGNHDDFQELFTAMRQHGITPLDNDGVQLQDGLYLAGVADLWNRTPDIRQATEGASKDDFVLLLCHNPDVNMQQNTERADLILSGHTHGGHATLFGLWAPALTLRDTITSYGQQFMQGWCKGAYGTDVFVSRGAGWFKNTPRVFARPEVVYITLRSAT